MFFNQLRVKSSVPHFDGVGIVYVMHGMGKHAQENHLGAIHDPHARHGPVNDLVPTPHIRDPSPCHLETRFVPPVCSLFAQHAPIPLVFLAEHKTWSDASIWKNEVSSLTPQGRQSFICIEKFVKFSETISTFFFRWKQMEFGWVR